MFGLIIKKISIDCRNFTISLQQHCKSKPTPTRDGRKKEWANDGPR